MREQLRAAGEADLAAWERVRALLRAAVGESRFDIWLAPLELIVVDPEGALVVSAPAETVGWVVRRFGRVLDGAAQRTGQGLRIADEVERAAAERFAPAAVAAARAAPVGVSANARSSRHVGSDGCAVDVQTALSGVVPSDRCRAGRNAQSTGRAT